MRTGKGWCLVCYRSSSPIKCTWITSFLNIRYSFDLSTFLDVLFHFNSNIISKCILRTCSYYSIRGIQWLPLSLNRITFDSYFSFCSTGLICIFYIKDTCIMWCLYNNVFSTCKNRITICFRWCDNCSTYTNSNTSFTTFYTFYALANNNFIFWNKLVLSTSIVTIQTFVKSKFPTSMLINSNIVCNRVICYLNFNNSSWFTCTTNRSICWSNHFSFRCSNCCYRWLIWFDIDLYINCFRRSCLCCSWLWISAWLRWRQCHFDFIISYSWSIRIYAFYPLISRSVW